VRETDEMVDDDEPMEGEKMYKLRMDSVPNGTMVAKEFSCKRNDRVCLRVLRIGPTWRRACGGEEGDRNHEIRRTHIGGDGGRWWCDV
jgi:hypothetical protein